MVLVLPINSRLRRLLAAAMERRRGAQRAGRHDGGGQSVWGAVSAWLSAVRLSTAWRYRPLGHGDQCQPQPQQLTTFLHPTPRCRPIGWRSSCSLIRRPVMLSRRRAAPACPAESPPTPRPRLFGAVAVVLSVLPRASLLLSLSPTCCTHIPNTAHSPMQPLDATHSDEFKTPLPGAVGSRMPPPFTCVFALPRGPCRWLLEGGCIIVVSVSPQPAQDALLASLSTETRSCWSRPWPLRLASRPRALRLALSASQLT